MEKTMNPIKEYSWDTIATWMVKDIKECVEYGQKHGVIDAIQNHNDFIQTAVIEAIFHLKHLAKATQKWKWLSLLKKWEMR